MWCRKLKGEDQETQVSLQLDALLRACCFMVFYRPSADSPCSYSPYNKHYHHPVLRTRYRSIFLHSLIVINNELRSRHYVSFCDILRE